MAGEIRQQVVNQMKGGKGGGGGGDKGGKGKGKSGKKGIPDKLVGKQLTFGDKRVCFAFNLEGCSNHTGAGGQCNKGWHICANPGCGGNHPMSSPSCPKQ